MDISQFKGLLDLPLRIKKFEGYGSWRGFYSEPAIFFTESDEFIPISDLKEVLEDLTSGRRFEGWKGGSFYFSNTYDMDVHFEYDMSNVNDFPITEFLSSDSIEYLKEFDLI